MEWLSSLFEWAQPVWMQYALVAVLLCTPMFGLIGTMVVNMRMSFFSDAIGHCAFTGMAIGSLMGVLQPNIPIVVFSVIFALGLTFVKNRASASADTIIGVFSSTSIAMGLVILSQFGGMAKLESYLVGNILQIGQADLIGFACLLGIVVLYWIWMYPQLLLISLNAPLAYSRGVSYRLVETSFTLLLAIIVAMSIRWVGILLINSLLILPAASARNVTRNMRGYTAASIGLAMMAGVFGLISSYYIDASTGAAIVLILALGYGVSLWIRSRRLAAL